MRINPADRILSHQIVRVDLSPRRDCTTLAVSIGRVPGQRLLFVVAPEVGRIICVCHSLAKVAKMMVETEVKRAAVVIGHPETPLAHDRRGVASTLQELRYGDGAWLHRVLAFSSRFALHVVAHCRVAQMSTCHQCTTTRRTDCAASVEVREPHPFRGHAVEIGRPDLRLPVTAEIAVSKVISQDENDVRLGLNCALRTATRGKSE